MSVHFISAKPSTKPTLLTVGLFTLARYWTVRLTPALPFDDNNDDDSSDGNQDNHTNNNAHNRRMRRSIFWLVLWQLLDILKLSLAVLVRVDKRMGLEKQACNGNTDRDTPDQFTTRKTDVM